MLNITKAIKTISIYEIKDFIFENYYKLIIFSEKIRYNSIKLLNKKNLLLLTNKLIKNIHDPRNAKEQYQSFIIKKNRKSVKQSEIITYQLKTFDIFDIKSVNTEHSNTSHKLFKTERHTHKVGSNSFLYSDINKEKNFSTKTMSK